VGPFHKVQSHRNRLLQCVSPTGSQVLPANLLRRGLLSPQVLAEASSNADSPWGHGLLRASTCSGVGSLPWATGEYLLHCGPPRAAGAQPASPWSSPWAAGESLPWHLEHIIPEVLPPSLMGSAFASGGSVLKPAGSGSVGDGGSFWQPLAEATPVAPFYQNLAVQTHDT